MEREHKIAEENGVLAELLVRVIAAGDPTTRLEKRSSVAETANPLAEDDYRKKANE